MSDTATAVVMLAKEPIPGKVKTRLHSRFSPDEAAQLARAAIRDTQAALRKSACIHRVLAWDGCATGWNDRFVVYRQPRGDLNARLAAAFASTFGGTLTAAACGTAGNDRVLLIGMDTPQVTPPLLDSSWDGADAVLGLSDDGGFWAIGLRRGNHVGAFDGVPMSTARTGAAQLGRLLNLGLTVKLLPPLLDVDTPAAAQQIADEYPHLAFSRTHAHLIEQRAVQACDAVFDSVYSGDAAPRAYPAEALAMDMTRWMTDADDADRLVVARCRGPVVDLGCGPGRMVRALVQSGRAAMGIDSSKVAVALSRAGGGPALRRDIRSVLPAQGRWRTVLLMDGNIGIGGDVADLLSRCRSLLAPGGLVLCEVDDEPDRHQRFDVNIQTSTATSSPIPWVRIGSRALSRVAAAANLIVEDQWTSGSRHFLALREPA